MKFVTCLKLIVLFSLIQVNLVSQVEPLIQNNWTTFTWPYNAYFPESNNGVNGHVGNACGHTAIARILHYHGFPVNGTKVLDFTDYFGNDWYCDLTDMNLNYTAMPHELNWNSPESKYQETAKLFLAAAAVGEKIEIGFRDSHLKVPGALEEYFNFSSNWLILNRWEISREEWMEIFKYELDNERPILVVGRTPDSPAPWEPGGWQGHWWICDGYNANDEFYVNYSFGGIKGYYDIDNLGGIYTAYNTIIVGLEPDLGDKSITITSPQNDDVFNVGDDINITWLSSSITNIDVSYSFDGGWTWQEVAGDISSSSGSYTWNSNDETSSECLIKITDSDDFNIYKNSNLFTIEDNTTNVAFEDSKVPSEFILYQNFPNPFNPSTTIHYSLPKRSYVQLIVYDMLGREVEALLSKNQSAGNHQIKFDGRPLNSGVYFCVMKADNFVSTIKLVLTK